MIQSESILLKYSNEIKNLIVFLFLCCVISWAFAPKITIIGVPGYEQGIRIEDLLFIICFSLFSYFSFIQFGSISVFGGKDTLYFISYLLISVLVSIFLFGTNPFSIVFTFRWLEYFLMGSILVWFALNNTNLLIVLIKTYIIFNLLLTPLSFLKGERFEGLTAGPWEVTSVLLFLFVGIKSYFITKKEFFFYLLSIFVVIIAAQARIQLIAFLVLLFYFAETKRIALVSTLVGAFIALFWGISSSAIQGLRFETINFESISEIYEAIRSSDSNVEFYALAEQFPDGDMSTLARMMIWANFINKWLSFGIYGIFFGIGAGVGGVVVDGLYIRLITELGIVGIFFFLRMLFVFVGRLGKSDKLLLLLLLGVISLTNDPFTSQRIFSSFCLAVGIMLHSNTVNPVLKVE